MRVAMLVMMPPQGMMPLLTMTTMMGRTQRWMMGAFGAHMEKRRRWIWTHPSVTGGYVPKSLLNDIVVPGIRSPH